MKLNILTIAIFLVINIFAQDIEYKDFKWEKSPKLHSLTAEEEALPEINILKQYVFEYAFEGESFYNFRFFHKIVKVNSDDAIQSNNKIYIPTGENEILETKARVINSKGEIKELDKDDIKESVDEESKQSYKYFALEGVDIGSEIEYFYLVKEYPNLTGKKVTFQNNTPSKKIVFELISPDFLEFRMKSYNGFPEVETDTTLEEKNKWFVHTEDVLALKDEPMSAFKANRQHIVYQLYKNYNTRKKDVYNYSDVAKNYYASTHTEVSKKAAKKLKALLKDADVASAKGTYSKIRKIEQYIKTNFVYQSAAHKELKDLEFILENKIASKIGLMKMYVALLNILEIKHQLVITSDRLKNKFDKDFESYSFLVNEFIYIKELDQFLHPTAIMSRLGYLPSIYTNTDALFIKPVTLGDFTTAVGKIKYIEALGHELSSDTLKVNIEFDTDDIGNPIISYTKAQKGLEIMSIQPLYDFITDEETIEELDEGISQFINADVEVKDLKIENKGGEHFGIHSLKTTATLKTSDFAVEQAGNKYLFKIGALIGPQMEMYQEKGHERQLDVEMNYNHSYYRTMTFNIPEGYQIKNLDDLNFDVSITYDGEKSSYFVSSYTVKDNTVTMYNEEVYDALYYPKEKFEEYRNVINAAADFNKVVLVLEKK